MNFRKSKSQNIGILFLSLILIFVNVFSASAQHRGSIIEWIDVQGNRRLSDEQFMKMISTRAGQTLSEKRLQNDLKTLLNSGQFDTTGTRVTTEPGVRGGINVIFEVRELPIIAEVNFDGLKYVKRDEIVEYLKSQKDELESGTPYTAAHMRKYRKMILDYLHERGFSEATVLCSEEEVSATSISIKFLIDEMPGDDEDQ